MSILYSNANAMFEFHVQCPNGKTFQFETIERKVCLIHTVSATVQKKVPELSLSLSLTGRFDSHGMLVYKNSTSSTESTRLGEQSINHKVRIIK